MAFQLERELASGVVGNYWRIKSALVDCDGNPTVAVYMNLYINKDAKDMGKAPILTQAVVLALSDVDMFYSYDFRACLYKALKSKAEWANAIDIFDDPNKMPIVTPVDVTTNFDTEVSFELVSMDIFNLPLTYSIVNNPANGTLELTSKTCTYTPNPGFYGIDEADFKTNNGEFDSELGHITINVLDTPDRPVANSQSFSTALNTSVEITLSGSDPNNLPLDVIVESNPVHGTVTETNGVYTYEPLTDFIGDDSFTFKVSNGTLVSQISTININVFDQNDEQIV